LKSKILLRNLGRIYTQLPINMKLSL